MSTENIEKKLDQIYTQIESIKNGLVARGYIEDDRKDIELYGTLVQLVQESGKASASQFQRWLNIGYARAVHYLDMLEEDGIIGPAHDSVPREVLKKK